MNVLLVGDSRFLQALQRSCNTLHMNAFHTDSQDRIYVAGLIIHERPSVVVIHTDTEDERPTAATTTNTFRANSLEPAYLAHLCNSLGIKVVLITESSVFPGSGPSRETDTTYPISVNGLSQSLGERAVLNIDPKNLVVRVGWLYGYEYPERGPMLAEQYVRGEKSVVYFPTDIVGSPTYHVDAAGSLAVALSSEEQGIRHLVPAWQGSWFEFLEEEYQGIRPTKTGKTKQPFPRNASLLPSRGWWTLPPGGLQRFRDDAETLWE